MGNIDNRQSGWSFFVGHLDQGGRIAVKVHGYFAGPSFHESAKFEEHRIRPVQTLMGPVTYP